MIQKYVDRFMANREAIADTIRQGHPDEYVDLVRTVVSHVTDEDDWRESEPDPDRIHVIDDGDYQGTLLFVIGAKGYQPSDYWTVSVGYGSCSGCDTLERIRCYSGDPVTDEQLAEYMTLALHIVQGLTPVGGESDE